MRLKNLINRAALVGVTVISTITALEAGGTITPKTVVATTTKPGQYCLSNDVGTYDAIRRGSKRLVVVVKAFRPATPASAGLVVSLLTADKTRKHELTQFAVHPLRAFSANELNRQQRFLVSLEEYAYLLSENNPICVELGFDASRSKLAGGWVEFYVEWVDRAGGEY